MTVAELQQVLLLDMERALLHRSSIDYDLWAVLGVTAKFVNPRVVAVSNPTGSEHLWLARLFLEES